MRTRLRRSQRSQRTILSATLAPSAGARLRARLDDAMGVPRAFSLWASLGLLPVFAPTAQGQGVFLTGDVFPSYPLQPGAPTWNVGGGLKIGDSGTGTLTVEAGGTVSNSTGILGYGYDSAGTATITGAGSSWTNSGEFVVGYYGQGTLRVEAGGRVSSSQAYLGRTDSAVGAVTVTGAGSTWTNDRLDLGYDFHGKGILRVEDGGGVSTTTSTVRNSSIATVTGAGSTWTIGDQLFLNSRGTLLVEQGGVVSARALTVGTPHGSGNLRIEAGGSVTNGAALVDYSSTATITGAGSTWTNSGELTLGSLGALDTIVTNYLNVEAGGAVSNTSGYLGSRRGTAGIATVTGAGSTWTNNGVLVIGGSGAGALTVEAGGRVSSAGGYIHFAGTATVDGTNSAWINSGVLELIGGPETSLRISDGGSVSNTVGTIAGRSSSRITVTVTGAGSTWTNSGALNLGDGLGGQGILNVEAGGRVFSDSSTILSSIVTVTGAGSTWTNNGNLMMYLRGNVEVKDGGRLSSGTITLGTPHGSPQGIRIEGGGRAESNAGYIGQSSTATVTGTGSTWTNSGELIVGDFVTGTLNVEAGGKVSNTHGYIGYHSRYVGAATSATGVATVTGAGSTWTNSGDLILGGSSPTTATRGSGTLHILDGALVSVGGTTRAHAGSVINLDGGTLDTGSLDVTDATLNHRDGTLRIHGGAYSQTADALVLSGDTASAKPRLELLGGATTTGIESVTIGDLAGRQGELLVSGGSALTSSGQITLGNHGTGTLNIGAYDRGDTAGIVTATHITTGSGGGGTINFNHTDVITSGVPISGNISVHQRGSGTTILNGDYTYTGDTIVSDGALFVNGSLINTSIQVTDGGTLGGSGDIMKFTLDEGARLAPGGEVGVSVGTLRADSLTWQPGARLVFDLGPATSDLLDLGGAFTKTGSGDYLFDFVDAGWQAGHTYTLIYFSDTNFTAEDFGFTNGGGFDGVFGLADGSLTFRVTAVPEPSSAAALAGLGALWTVASRRRRRAG